MADEKFADLVFEGGGVKGIGLAGAFAALEQRGFTRKGVAGASAGAITAALIAAGYSSRELDEILLNVPFGEFKDKGWEDRVPLIGPAGSLLLERGIYEGKFFERWMTELLEAKMRLIEAVEVDAVPDGPMLDELYERLRALGPALLQE